MGGLEVLRAQYMPSRFFLLSFYAVVVVDVIWTKGNAIHMHASLLFSCGGPAVYRGRAQPKPMYIYVVLFS